MTVYDTFQFGEKTAGSIGTLVGTTAPPDPVTNQPAFGFIAQFDTILTRIKVRASSDNASVIIRIWDDDSGIPGALLEDWTVDTGGPGFQDLVVDSVSTPQLTADETYWVSLALDDDVEQGTWRFADADISLRAITDTNGPGGTWFPLGGTGSVGLLKVEGACLQPVPVLGPGSFGALMVLVAVGGGVAIRRRQSRRA